MADSYLLSIWHSRLGRLESAIQAISATVKSMEKSLLDRLVCLGEDQHFVVFRIESIASNIATLTGDCKLERRRTLGGSDNFNFPSDSLFTAQTRRMRGLRKVRCTYVTGLGISGNTDLLCTADCQTAARWFVFR